jgi:transposase
LPPDRARQRAGYAVLRRPGPRAPSEQWEYLPQELAGGSGMTCWRRRQDWHERGVWYRLHRLLLDRLGPADRIGWARAALDSASRPAVSNGRITIGEGPRGHI